MNSAQSRGNSAPPAFIARQRAFAARIRDPLHVPLPAGVEARRMALYQELFFNNILEFLANAFPVLRALHDDKAWQALARDFYATHRSRTPLFHELPREFLHYLEAERRAECDYPFLLELAHYEWLELELATASAELAELAEPAEPGPQHELLTTFPTLSPLLRLVGYRYPVHQIGPDYRPNRPGERPTQLALYRGRDEAVHFLELNPVTARLLHLIGEESGRSCRELLEAIADELAHPNPATVLQGGAEILADLAARSVVLLKP